MSDFRGGGAGGSKIVVHHLWMIPFSILKEILILSKYFFHKFYGKNPHFHSGFFLCPKWMSLFYEFYPAVARQFVCFEILAGKKSSLFHEFYPNVARQFVIVFWREIIVAIKWEQSLKTKNFNLTEIYFWPLMTVWKAFSWSNVEIVGHLTSGKREK